MRCVRQGAVAAEDPQPRERDMNVYKAHCLVLPFPAQGHINPMIQFSRRLNHKGVQSTLVTTHFIFKTSMCHTISSIPVETISDGYDEGGISSAESMEAYMKCFRQVGPLTLRTLLWKLQASKYPIDSIIYDPQLPWALDVAKEFGLVGAAFFTQSCAVDNIAYHVYQQLIELPIPVGVKEVSIPGLTPLEPSDLPSFVYDFGSYPTCFDAMVNQFSNIDKADWIFCNTFYKLEQEVVDWMAKHFSLRTIGPTIPSMYLDKQIQDDDNYSLNLFKPVSDLICTNWLNDKPNRSVVYVSFGSVADLKVEQMEELARGLKESNYHFLWVVRSSEEGKLPRNFSDEVRSEKGLVVSWCAQLQVLEHEAIGCFITHCGWNSTLEALSLGVPLIGMPQWTDQTTNAKYVMDVWGTGLRARPDDNGIVRREEIVHCISELMGKDRGKDVRLNSMKWKKLAKEAMDEGGSSDRNVDEFITSLVHSKSLY